MTKHKPLLGTYVTFPDGKGCMKFVTCEHLSTLTHDPYPSWIDSCIRCKPLYIRLYINFRDNVRSYFRRAKWYSHLRRVIRRSLNRPQSTNKEAIEMARYYLANKKDTKLNVLFYREYTDFHSNSHIAEPLLTFDEFCAQAETT